MSSPRRVGLVSCVKSKRSEASPAKDLYTSPLFRGARAAVEASCDRWYILSAKHGLLDPDQVVEPYEQTLKTASRAERRGWSKQVVAALAGDLGALARLTFELHAGKDYYAYGLEDGLRARGARVEIPVRGLSMGKRLAYYGGAVGLSPGAETGTPTPRPAASGTPRDIAPPTGKYRPLYESLLATKGMRQDLSFQKIEETLGSALPASARRHPAWWANGPGGHPHSRALAGGWLSDNQPPPRH